MQGTKVANMYEKLLFHVLLDLFALLYLDRGAIFVKHRFEIFEDSFVK